MGREGEVVAKLLPEFERQNPGIRVRVQQIPWSAAHEKLLTAYVGGTMPDVFQAGNTWLPELAAVGAVEPLDAFARASGAVDLSDYFPGIVETNVIEGTLCGLPWYVDTRLLFYRRDLAAATGSPGPPRTWDEWLEIMRRVHRYTDGRTYGILLPLREWQPLVILALQLGAELLREGDQYGNFRSPAFRRAFEFYLHLFALGLAPRTGEAQLANLYSDFAQGLFCFVVTGPWNLGEFAIRLPAAVRDLWAVAPLPAPDAAEYPGVSLAGGASLAISRRSPRRRAAWRLIEYLAAPQTQVAFYRLTGDLPARRSAWQQAGLASDARAGAFWLQLHRLRATPKVPEWERIAAKIAAHAEAAIRGQRTVGEALAALDADADRILEKRRWLLRRARPRQAAATPGARLEIAPGNR